MNDLFNLSGGVYIVTGGCGLLGRRHCEAIASAGGIPIIIDLNKKNAEECADYIVESFNIPAKGYAVDISNESRIQENLDEILSIFGHIDGLVNNAARNPKVEANESNNFTRLESFTLENWNSDLSVGLTGAFLCCKYYGTKISHNPKGGVILNISSDLGIIAPDQNLYCDNKLKENEQPVKPITYSVIKSGLIGLTRYISTYWPQKVRCNALCPGGVHVSQSDEFLSRIKEKIPMRRMANVDEYQGTIIYMLSRASSYMNGAIVSVDGGRTAW